MFDRRKTLRIKDSSPFLTATKPESSHFFQKLSETLTLKRRSPFNKPLFSKEKPKFPLILENQQQKAEYSYVKLQLGESPQILKIKCFYEQEQEKDLISERERNENKKGEEREEDKRVHEVVEQKETEKNEKKEEEEGKKKRSKRSKKIDGLRENSQFIKEGKGRRREECDEKEDEGDKEKEKDENWQNENEPEEEYRDEEEELYFNEFFDWKSDETNDEDLEEIIEKNRKNLIMAILNKREMESEDYSLPFESIVKKLEFSEEESIPFGTIVKRLDFNDV